MGSSEGNEPQSISVGSLSDLANVSHQKGDVQMITTTRDKIESLLDATNSLSSNFFAAMLGIAVSILLALKSGGIEESWRPTFWLAFWLSLVLVFFFGLSTLKDERKKRSLRRALIKDVPPVNPLP